MDSKKKFVVYLCIAIFGVIGVYLTFFESNVDKYDSQARAYDIAPNESYDGDDGTMYHPIYYFKVNGDDYKCESKSGSSISPNDKKNIVYYDSSNPENCATQFDKSSFKIGGIVFLVVTVLLILVLRFPPKANYDGEYNVEDRDIDASKIEKANEVIWKVNLVYKRIILGILIFILLIIVLIDSFIMKQTIEAWNYIDTTATYVERRNSEDSEIFDDLIYSFKDWQGNEQTIRVAATEDETPKEEIQIKYDENDPQEYYVEGATFDKKGIVFFVVKVVVLVLLICLFFNKRLLSKVYLSYGGN